jgi:hypothetical protein
VVVNTQVQGVVAHTVPLIFILAVQVRFVTVQLVGVQRIGVTSVGEVVVGRTVQVQLNVYSADAQAHSNQAIVEAVAVCHEDVQAKFDKLEWVEEAVQLGILSNKEVIAAVAASF